MESDDPDYLPDVQQHPKPHPDEDQPDLDDPPDPDPDPGLNKGNLTTEIMS